MVKADEKVLMILLYGREMFRDMIQMLTPAMGRPLIIMADELGEYADIPPKRVYYLLNKWSAKDWFEWGMTMRTGWLTDAGKARARNFMGEEE